MSHPIRLRQLNPVHPTGTMQASPTTSKLDGRSGGERMIRIERAESRRCRLRRRQASVLLHGHVPLPIRYRAPHRPSGQLHPQRHHGPLPQDAGQQCPPSHGLGRIRAPGRAAREQTGIHPAETTRNAIDNFRRQLKRFSLSCDWSVSSRPSIRTTTGGPSGSGSRVTDPGTTTHSSGRDRSMS